jgi:hypothetical protein
LAVFSVLLALATAADALPFGAFGRPASQPAAIALTGRDWVNFGPDERDAYLAGFIAGAATYQATGGRAISGTSAAASVARLQQTNALAFAFGGNVYRSGLDDYFFYQNRRREMLVQALVELNSHLRSVR